MVLWYNTIDVASGLRHPEFYTGLLLHRALKGACDTSYEKTRRVMLVSVTVSDLLNVLTQNERNVLKCRDFKWVIFDSTRRRV